MSLARIIHDVKVDVEQLINLYQQLDRIPPQVQHLFRKVHDTNKLLTETEELMLQHGYKASANVHTSRFQAFQDNLIDIELFVDPEQRLPRSGPESTIRALKSWAGTQDISHESLSLLESYLLEICHECEILNTELTRPTTKAVPRDLNSEQTKETQNEGLQFNFYGQNLQASSPFTNAVHSPNFTAGRNMNNAVLPLLPISYFSLSDSTRPVPILPLQDAGLTLANLPSSTSTKRKRKDKTLAELHVQSLIEQQYGRSMAAGTKRKRPDSIFGSVHSAFPSHPPPEYLAPSSPRLGPREVADDNPDWSLDDIQNALPEVIPRSSHKGKERATNHGNGSSSPASSSSSYATTTTTTAASAIATTTESAGLWETASSARTESSSDSVRSSGREGSIFSVASQDRMYEEGACKLWYRNQNSGLAQLCIAHIEVKRASIPSGSCISVYSRMADSKTIRDDLWMASVKANASPFFENREIVNAMRNYHDGNIACIIKFAPNPAEHPQYSFSTMQDGCEFIQHVVQKTLICSMNVSSIKSACTHGHSVESGVETIQIWEEDIESGRSRNRSVKFFRNKNAATGAQVIEFNCNTLRPPENDARSGKVTFRFRDTREGIVRDMKYLKIAFTNDEEKETFIHEVGFSGHSKR